MRGGSEMGRRGKELRERMHSHLVVHSSNVHNGQDRVGLKPGAKDSVQVWGSEEGRDDMAGTQPLEPSL